jgi:hypothetical protein
MLQESVLTAHQETKGLMVASSFSLNSGDAVNTAKLPEDPLVLDKESTNDGSRGLEGHRLSVQVRF